MRTLTALLLWAWAAHAAAAVTLGRGKEASQNMETLKRSKRGWMWKQFFLQEEYTGTDYQYIGKVSFKALIRLTPALECFTTFYSLVFPGQTLDPP